MYSPKTNQPSQSTQMFMYTGLREQSRQLFDDLEALLALLELIRKPALKEHVDKVSAALRDEISSPAEALTIYRDAFAAAKESMIARDKKLKIVSDHEKNSYLSTAAERGNHLAVKQLLKIEGIDVNYQDGQAEHKPLYISAARGHYKVIWELRKKINLDGSIKDSQGTTPLMLAAWEKHDAAVTQLLRIPGVDLRATNTRGDSALSVAVKFGHRTIIYQLCTRLLLEAPSDEAQATLTQLNKELVPGLFALTNETLCEYLVEHGSKLGSYEQNRALLIDALSPDNAFGALMTADNRSRILETLRSLPKNVPEIDNQPLQFLDSQLEGSDCSSENGDPFKLSF